MEILGAVEEIEIIAAGRSIRELTRLKRIYGPGRWRKMKGIALVRLEPDKSFRAEIHWYEAHGIGRKEFKIKRIFED